MTLGFCAVCLAADTADPANLQALVRYQAAQLDRLTQADTFELDAARLRIGELESIVVRLNASIQSTNRTGSP